MGNTYSKWYTKYLTFPVKWILLYPFRIYKIKSIRKHLPELEKKMHEKDNVTVVFFVMNLSMWKLDRMYALMQCSHRFRPIIVMVRCSQYSDDESKREEDKMVNYFNQIGAVAINAFNDDINVRKCLNPDIIFYQQPYRGVIPSKYEYFNFPKSLICYIPYDFKTTAFKWGYDTVLQNIAWKLFYPTILHKQDAIRLSFVKGKNVVVCGYPTADDFLDKNRRIRSEWKPCPTNIKKIIWAPHHSIDSCDALNYSTFLRYSNFMLELAEKYKDLLQIAFKPHPWLRSKLYKHPDWGKDKTDEYYQRWDNLNNGFCSNGNYIDLFLTSDAMIHDCGSFSVEYHYTLNPVMFLTKPDHLEYESQFGSLAFDMHYKGYNKEDIYSFIDNVVLGGKDVMRPLREDFFNTYLNPPCNISVAENIMNNII